MTQTEAKQPFSRNNKEHREFPIRTANRKLKSHVNADDQWTDDRERRFLYVNPPPFEEASQRGWVASIHGLPRRGLSEP